MCSRSTRTPLVNGVRFMEIESAGLPHSGQQFRFTVVGGIGRTGIEVYIDGKRIYADDCPDPPCHEMIEVPQGARGATLRVIAKDSVGKTSEREFIVRDSEDGVGGAMSAES